MLQLTSDDRFSLLSFMDSLPAEFNLNVRKTKWLSPGSLQKLRPSTMLNDEIINGCPTLLSDIITAATPTAMFNSFLLESFQGNPEHPSLKKIVQMLRCRDKNIWIIPINLKGISHWMVATIYVQERRIDIFDSLSLDLHVQDVSQVCVLYMPYPNTLLNIDIRIYLSLRRNYTVLCSEV